MPDVPVLPTDNLYKFLALSGVALVVLGLWLQEKLLGRVERYSDQLALDLGRTGGAIDWLTELTEATQSPTLTPHAASILLPLLLDRKERAVAKHARDKAKAAILRGRIAVTRRRAREATALIAFGGVVALFGFGGWYYRLQKPQDDLLQLQLRTVSDSANGARSTAHRRGN